MANQCPVLIPASTYPLSSVGVGPAHTFLARTPTLFYDPAFTVGQTVQLDPELDPDIHWGLCTGFEFNTALSGTFSTIIDPNGALPNTILVTDNHLAPGTDGLQAVPQISPTHAVTEICDWVGARPPACQTERALGHPDRAYDHSRDPLQGSQALAYGLSQAPVVTLGVRQPTAKAVGLATELAMVPMTSPAMVLP